MDRLIAGYALEALAQQTEPHPRPTGTWPGERLLEALQQQKASLQERWHSEEISDSLYFSELVAREAEFKRLANDRKAWAVRQQSEAQRHIDAQAVWETADPDRKREILFSLLKSVIILPGKKGSHRFDPSTVVPVWQTAETTPSGE